MSECVVTYGSLVALLTFVGAARAQSPPSLESVDRDLARVEDHPEEGVLEVVIGPAQLEPGSHLRLPIQLVDVPIEGWLHGFDWYLKDGQGRQLPDDLLHHVNLIDPDRRELFAPIARRVMAAGRETGEQSMPELLGYPVEAGTRFLVNTMLASPDVAREDVYLHIRLHYSGVDENLLRPREVYPFYLDVMGPVGPKSFAVPPGRTVKSWEGSPAIDGRILAVGGHMHDYAEELRLEDVTTGDTIWRTEPDLNEAGRVASVPTSHLWWRGGVRLRSDHRYRIVVEYYNPTDEPAPDGGMGVIGGVVLALRAADWPDFDRTDPAYVTDLRRTLTTPEMGEHGHGAHGHGSH